MKLGCQFLRYQRGEREKLLVNGDGVVGRSAGSQLPLALIPIKEEQHSMSYLPCSFHG